MKYVMFVPSVISAGLCYWQLERKAWKEELIAQKDDLAKLPPIDILSVEGDLDAFRPIKAEGTYQHQHSLYVGPRPKSIGPTTKQGFVIFTPLLGDNREQAVLVNRGWVPEAWVTDPQVREGGEPGGRVRVEGVVQPDEQPSSFVPDNVPSEGRFFYINGADMAEACGLPPTTRILQRIARPGNTGEAPLQGGKCAASSQFPEPKSEDTLLKYSVMPLDHLGYAAVWGSLSGALAWMALRFVRKGR